MVLATSIISASLIFSIFIGQLWRLQIFGLEFPLIDLVLPLFTFVSLYQNLKIKNKQPQNRYYFYFFIFTLTSLVFNLIHYRFQPYLPFAYFIRLTCLVLLLLYPPKFEQNLQRLLILALVANVIFGYIQYFFWPDLVNFKFLGWDPHLYRLVSTYLDPTFTGLIFLLLLIHLYVKKIYYPIPFLYLALALTYSRSTLLALLIVSLSYAIKTRKIKYFIFTSLIILATVILLPRQPGEGTKLERTSSIKAKIENYKQGLDLFKKSPIIGIGYNNIKYFKSNDDKTSHADNGFDSSLLTILVSTGIVGLILFLLGGLKYYQSLDLTHQLMLESILIHSLFANSLLYPWTIPLFLLL